VVGWKEDEIHRWLRRLGRPRGLAGGRGHDAAVLARGDWRPVVCIDQTIEGVHCSGGTPPHLVGRKAAGRALSDLAATAAAPRAILLGLAAPRTRSSKWVRGVIAGARSMAREHGADLVAGDLACTRGPAVVSVAALGDLGGRKTPPARGRARPGELVLLTGPVGGSLAGRHLRIRPRIRAGRRLHDAGATAMMDVSDGLAWDLHRLARASGVRIEIDLERVPVHEDARAAARTSGRDPLWHALHDGEDHELVACIAPGRWRRCAARARRRFPALRVVGRVLAGRGLLLRDARGATRRWKPGEGGWSHGAG